MATIDTAKWLVIESEECGEDWIQVAFRYKHDAHREYLVLGQVSGDRFEEEYSSDYDDNKSLAYSYYYEKLDTIEHGD